MQLIKINRMLYIIMKSEDMTNLKDDIYVSKIHPIITFRGALDSLEAMILEVQHLAAELKEEYYLNALKEIYAFTQDIMYAEVTGNPFVRDKLFGLTLETLHEQSHNVKEYFGFPHPAPDHTMGILSLKLNTLRTRVREIELTAINTFSSTDTHIQKRDDIVTALNRLSSAIYWLFCKNIV